MAHEPLVTVGDEEVAHELVREIEGQLAWRKEEVSFQVETRQGAETRRERLTNDMSSINAAESAVSPRQLTDLLPGKDWSRTKERSSKSVPREATSSRALFPSHSPIPGFELSPSTTTILTFPLTSPFTAPLAKSASSVMRRISAWVVGKVRSRTTSLRLREVLASQSWRRIWRTAP